MRSIFARFIVRLAVGCLLAACGDVEKTNIVTGKSKNAASVVLGDSHSCSPLSDGLAECWGRNNTGQLGNTAPIQSLVPVEVTGLSSVVEMTGGGGHTCARLSDGTLRCWGDNTSGQLGVSWTLISLSPLVNITISSTPVVAASSSITTATVVAAGGDHTCAIIADGRVRCWGENAFGQLGNGSNIGFTSPGIGGSSTSTIVPVSAAGVTNATALDAGLFHSCARISDASAKCWGLNTYGQLGDGTGIDSATPVEVE